MDVFEAIKTRLEVRDYSSEPVPKEVLKEVLEAGRLSPSGLNTQHWRFIVVEDRRDLQELADISTSGKWVAGAAFAVVILTNPKYPWHLIDAGRVVTHMQLAAWNRNLGSCIYTGYDEKAMRQKLNIPENYHIACVAGFGYPRRRIIGRKRRLPLESIAFSGRMTQPLT
ncbi:MAG: nitroreductase family protein [Candidatus Caldarchaeum sp.]|nr:nitroreductase family protein [Candidatus Caldarchaeum sp.]MCS7133702.1 nitroreductase family protein [Candidatus Caldarchaeum sp.]MCX8200746.1 nitroreductase family protein [Candidatus Caldarchaeum sp.]MDW8062753.1 nitroreductase family protein [Candidatus Caldarchaeum sp.]MDW8434655.1 nitroreductase family protein [Candidatus Caldarchaeum sp.]